MLPVLVAALPPPGMTQTLSSPAVQQIVQTYAGEAVRTGTAVGIAVGVVYKGLTPITATYGYADIKTGTPVSASTLFEGASLAKVFATNMLGQAVANHQLSLNTSLSQFSSQLGPLPAMSGQVTLLELGDFTAGFPFRPPVCNTAAPLGCMPNDYPALQDYSISNFISYTQNAPLMNYISNPPVPLAALPGPTSYSDVSIGLLGYLLSTPSGLIDNNAMNSYYSLMNTQILAPLGMSNTYISVPPAALPNLASGYQQAGGYPAVSGGGIAKIIMTSHGTNYTSTPAVTVIGGGGTGAITKATVTNGSVSGISIINRGTGYIAPAAVTFSPVNTGCTVSATAIISAGAVTGFSIPASTGNCSFATPPAVSITGGRLPGGVDATAIAHVASNKLTYISVQNGGSGYADPLAVVVEPGGPNNNPVTAWAPAGSLSTNIVDLTKFLTAATGYTSASGQPVPAVLTQGFKIAQTEYACVGKSPALPPCPKSGLRYGLAWLSQPASADGSAPRVIYKLGGLAGFSSAMVLMPDKQIGVAVLVNGSMPNADVAKNVANGVAHSLLYDLH